MAGDSPGIEQTPGSKATDELFARLQRGAIREGRSAAPLPPTAEEKAYDEIVTNAPRLGNVSFFDDLTDNQVKGLQKRYTQAMKSGSYKFLASQEYPGPEAKQTREGFDNIRNFLSFHKLQTMILRLQGKDAFKEFSDRISKGETEELARDWYQATQSLPYQTWQQEMRGKIEEQDTQNTVMRTIDLLGQFKEIQDAARVVENEIHGEPPEGYDYMVRLIDTLKGDLQRGETLQEKLGQYIETPADIYELSINYLRALGNDHYQHNLNRTEGGKPDPMVIDFDQINEFIKLHYHQLTSSQQSELETASQVVREEEWYPTVFAPQRPNEEPKKRIYRLISMISRKGGVPQKPAPGSNQ